jgi:nicotinamidase-related amidase
MLVDFFERSSELSNVRADLVASINQLADAFRDAGEPVVWIRQEFKPDLSDAFLSLRRDGDFITVAGTEGAQILPELHIDERDRIIIKKRYSAFFGTELDDVLTSHRVSSVILAGVNSHACVRTTAIDAYQRDYDIVLASECIASSDPEHHDVTIRYLAAQMAAVSSNDDIIGILRADSN